MHERATIRARDAIFEKKFPETERRRGIKKFAAARMIGANGEN
jgi:hypothetical protein